MKVTVKFASALACITDNHKMVNYELNNHSTLDNLIDLVDQQFSGFKSTVCTNRGEVADHINVYVNGDNIRYLVGLDTQLNDGDAIHIIPAAAAG